MKKILVGALLCLLTPLSTSVSAQGLQEGKWVGRVIHLTGRHMNVVYDVSRPADSLYISMEVEGYGSFEFRDVRATRDSLSFTWDPSFALECSMYLLEDGVYQGACMDPWGGFGGIVMAPPGSDVDTIELHDKTIESIAGWVPPAEEEELPSLGDMYPLGRTVVVDGRTVNVVEAGAGPVTVVFEAALGDNLTTWEYVQRVLSGTVRVVAYDRAGLGYSEPSNAPRTPEQIATELHALLRAAEIPPPYVFVGHAEGALYVRRFASLYPSEVVGLVLIDPSHEKQAIHWRSLSASSWEEYWTKKSTFYQMMPEPVQAELAAFSQLLKEGTVPGLNTPEVPTVVLTSQRASEKPSWIGETPQGRRAWRDFHRDWVRSMKDGTHIIVEESISYIHQEAPERIIEAIEGVIVQGE